MNAISLVLNALQNEQGVTDLVSTRIYLNEADQKGVMPQIVLTDVSDTPINDLAGEASTYNENIQIDIHSKSYGQAKSISDQVRAAISVEAAFNAVRQNTQKVKDLETNIQRWIIDYSIWYTTA